MTPAQIKLLIEAAICVALVAAGAVGGWMVNGWRLGTEVATLEGTVETQKQGLETFEGANKRCVAGLTDVKTAVKGFVDAAAARSEAAARAMKAAEEGAKKHQEAAEAALSRPMPTAGAECAAIVKEALDYANKRKAAK